MQSIAVADDPLKSDFQPVVAVFLLPSPTRLTSCCSDVILKECRRGDR
jgi:hypothetical protein